MSSVSNTKKSLSFVLMPLFAALAFAGCNSSGSGDSSSSAGSSTGITQSKVAVGPTCVTGDSSHLCLAIHFVSYENNGQTIASRDQAQKIVSTMNDIYAQCNMGFQIETYESVDPTQQGLSYGANAVNQLDQIRNTYGTEGKELLAVTTGPWGTVKNAWTNMPGSGPYGAIMEASVVDYGSGIIYAHEFGHYLGLDHVSDTSNLMDAIIYTDSKALTQSQCQTMRDTAQASWSAMLR